MKTLNNELTTHEIFCKRQNKALVLNNSIVLCYMPDYSDVDINRPLTLDIYNNHAKKLTKASSITPSKTIRMNMLQNARINSRTVLKDNEEDI